jgi:hypothetical protein
MSDTRTLIRSERHDRARSLGWLAVAWMEHFLVHGPGDVQGRPLDPNLPDALPLDDEFAGFVVDLYAYSDDGRRLYKQAFISRAKGRAKSELAGFIALFEAFGPARIDRDAFGLPAFAKGGEVFQHGTFRYIYEAGEPMGRPVTYPFVRVLATEEGQAGNTYDNVFYNLGGYGEGAKRLIEAYQIKKSQVNLSRILLDDGGEIVPSTASSASKDGGKETCAVFDEIHLYITPDLHRMHRTVSRNLEKRREADPFSLATSTMYAPGEESIAEIIHRSANLMREGKAKIDRLLFDHRQASPLTKLDDHDSLLQGLKDAYGDAAAWMDLESMIQFIWDPQNPVSDSRRYFLNQPTGSSDAWLTAPDWGACGRDDLEPLADGDVITLGFDGSQKRARGVADATALIACRLEDGALIPIHIWEQPAGPQGDSWRVPVEEVEAYVADTFDRFNVVAFYADPSKWESSIAMWERHYGPKLKVKSSTKNPIEWWMTVGRSVLVERALERFQNAVNDRELIHGNHPTLTRHALNARRRPTSGGHMKIEKEHKLSRNKIDAIVAAVLAFEARADAIAQGVRPRGRRRSRVMSL